MLCRKLIGPTAVVAALTVAGIVQAAESAKYPDWKGAWQRFVPAVSVVSPSGLRTPGGQPAFDRAAAASGWRLAVIHGAATNRPDQ